MEMVARRPKPAHPPRIRALLARARAQPAAERFWSLAVAQQLIEEHLADLYRRAARSLSRSYRRRAERAQRAWGDRLVAVRAELHR